MLNDLKPLYSTYNVLSLIGTTLGIRGIILETLLLRVSQEWSKGNQPSYVSETIKFIVQVLLPIQIK